MEGVGFFCGHAPNIGAVEGLNANGEPKMNDRLQDRLFDEYHSRVIEVFDAIVEERDAIERAAALMAEQIARDKVIFVGTGGAHGVIGIEEVFYRAGGLACISPMLDGAICLLNGAIRTTKMERLDGYGRTVVDVYGVGEGDLMVIAAPVGITPMAIDSAMAAKERGARVIGIATMAFAENVPFGHPSRHKSNKSLDQVSDVFVNCHVPYGDAVLSVEGVKQRFAPISTIALSFTENLIVCRTVELLIEKGVQPPVWRSSNTAGGDDANARYIEKYGSRVASL